MSVERPRWTSNRLVLAIRLITVLPPAPRLTIDELAAELDATRKATRRLLRDLDRSGVRVLAAHRPEDGRKVYGLRGADQELVRRLLA